jgi:hypothetical protein
MGDIDTTRPVTSSAAPISWRARDPLSFDSLVIVIGFEEGRRRLMHDLGPVMNSGRVLVCGPPALAVRLKEVFVRPHPESFADGVATR